MQQAAYQIGGLREIFGFNSDYAVYGFCGSKVMAHRADTAQALYQRWSFPVRPSLYESFEPSELHYVHLGAGHLTFAIQLDRDPTVTLDSRYRVYDYLFFHDSVFFFFVKTGLSANTQSYLNSEPAIE
jgi:hypothetical protein